MHALASPDTLSAVTGAEASPLDAEFHRRLPELATLGFRVAYSVLRQREDAEDVAQEALVRSQRRLGRLRQPGRLLQWFVRITWRLALDHRRAAQRREQREAGVAAIVAVDAELEAAARERRERLWQAIDALPDKLRLAVVLSGIEGQTTREVSEQLGVPEGTVKSRLHLARRRLMEDLRDLR
jgi:RNA polymerase sigma-70 factor (ECF subfamily)